jgi:hypothetical protein
MPYYTHHKQMGTHHYELVDVLPECSIDCMLYYTICKYKGTHQYVCVNEF